TVTDPAGNAVVTTYSLSPYSRQEKSYRGSPTGGTLLKTVDRAYTFLDALTVPLLTSETTTLDPGTPSSVSRTVQTDWDSMVVYTSPVNPSYNVSTTWRNVKARREYGYDGTLKRSTVLNYLHLDSSNPAPYRAANVADQVIEKWIYNGSGGAPISSTQYTYDGSLLARTDGTPAPNHDYTKYSYTNNRRGNLGSVLNLR